MRELKHIMRKLIDRIVFFSLNNTIVLVLILLCVLLGILSDNFFTSPNLLNILNNFAVRGIVAFGVAVVIFAGGIDLSFSSILVCCAILATYLQPKPVSILAVILPLLLGAGLGLINGLIVAKLGINPLIATLGTQWVFQASLFLITRAGQFQGKTDNYFHYFGHGKILNIPFPIFLLLACCVLCWVITKKTLLGKYIFAHGSKSEALKLSGVNASNINMLAYVIMGIFVGIGGILLSSRLIAVRSTEGGRYLIPVLTAVILSGASLSGGRGSIINVLIAVLVIGVIDNAMVLFAVAYKDQQVVRGCVFILSVLLNNYMLKIESRYARRHKQAA